MTADFERVVLSIQQEMALFTGTLAMKSEKAAFFALHALIDPSPDVLSAMAEARSDFENNHYIDGDHAWHYIFGHCDAPPLWGPGEMRDAREWFDIQMELAGWKAAINTILGEQQ